MESLSRLIACTVLPVVLFAAPRLGSADEEIVPAPPPLEIPDAISDAPEPPLKDVFSPEDSLATVDCQCDSATHPLGLCDCFGLCDCCCFSETIYSRYGVFHLGDDPPRPIVPRFGEVAFVGSHTQAFTLEAGVAGVAPIHGMKFLYDASATPGIYGRQWGYEFRGFQAHFVSEYALSIPIYRHNLSNLYELGFGQRIDWYTHESFRQLGDGPLGDDDDYSILNQRIGTYFVQIDHTTADCFERFRAEFSNDSGWVGGDDGDQFRTAAVRLRYLRQKGRLQIRTGLTLDMFTGEVDKAFVDENGFYILDDLHFSDWSQGLFELELGTSWFMPCGRHLGEFGISISLGPDTENIRDFFQNQLIHNRSSDVPGVPKVDRGDRLKSDIMLFYILHFG